jgi:hypothetical protein
MARKKGPFLHYLTDGKPGHHYFAKTILDGTIAAATLGLVVLGYKTIKPRVEKLYKRPR